MTPSDAGSAGYTGEHRRAVTGVLLDSGGVLIRPIGGDWFPTASLEAVLETHGIAWQQDNLATAAAAGYAYLDSVHHIRLRDEAAEQGVMARYHEVILEGVGVTRGGVALAQEILALEAARDVVEPYEWTVEVLAGLQACGIPVVVLSNAWPSLRRLHRGLGLDHYVQAFVISAEEGMSKPDARLFSTALAVLGQPPEQVLFVDDWAGHVEAANALGIRGVWLRHGDQEPVAGLEQITDLRAVLDLLI